MRLKKTAWQSFDNAKRDWSVFTGPKAAASSAKDAFGISADFIGDAGDDFGGFADFCFSRAAKLAAAESAANRRAMANW